MSPRGAMLARFGQVFRWFHMLMMCRVSKRGVGPTCVRTRIRKAGRPKPAIDIKKRAPCLNRHTHVRHVSKSCLQNTFFTGFSISPNMLKIKELGSGTMPDRLEIACSLEGVKYETKWSYCSQVRASFSLVVANY